VLGKGYTAGVGMSIGTAFGRMAGVNAANAVKKIKTRKAEHAAI
jgi:tricarballylate dehydrogenase